MSRKTLKIKGMGSPRICIWILGFVHGHFLKTATVDADTGRIYSCYLLNKKKLFTEFSFNRVKLLELELKAVRSEAAFLMAKETRICRNLEMDAVETSHGLINEKRNARRCISRRNGYMKEKEETVKRLIEIDSKIRSCEVRAKEEINAMASGLQSRFATYAQGMMVRSGGDNLIPEIEANTCFEVYNHSHEKENQKLQQIIKEAVDYE